MNTENKINFRYIAINSDGKKVAGKISVSDETRAREELHKLGLSVLSISKAEESSTHTKEGLAVFEFEGYDKTEKFVKGTIEGSSILPVYRRLVEEYKFKITYLVSAGASVEEKQNIRQNGISKIEQDYKNSRQNDQGVVSSDQPAESNEKEQAYRQELLAEVDKISVEADKFISDYFSKISGDTRVKLSETAKNLRTIRNSNNLNNVKITMDSLKKQIADAEVEAENRMNEVRDDGDNFKSVVEKKQSDEQSHDYESRLKDLYQAANSSDLASGIREDIKNVIKMNEAGEAYTRLRVKTKIYLAKKKVEREEMIKEKPHERHWAWVELHRFSGILLLFYLVYFVLAGLIITKDMGLGIESTIAPTVNHTILQQIMLFVFVFYCFGQVYEYYFRRASIFTIAGLGLFGLFSYVFLAVNL